MIDLGMLPGRTISEPRGINDNKLIVGLCANEETSEPFVWEDQIAFIWREGEMFPLSEIIGVPNNIDIMIADEINNQGQIIGLAFNSDLDEEYFFLWTPHCPVADAGDDQTVSEEDCMAFVTLDGSGSTDPDSAADTNDDIVSFFMKYQIIVIQNRMFVKVNHDEQKDANDSGQDYDATLIN